MISTNNLKYVHIKCTLISDYLLLGMVNFRKRVGIHGNYTEIEGTNSLSYITLNNDVLHLIFKLFAKFPFIKSSGLNTGLYCLKIIINKNYVPIKIYIYLYNMWRNAVKKINKQIINTVGILTMDTNLIQ